MRRAATPPSVLGPPQRRRLRAASVRRIWFGLGAIVCRGPPASALSTCTGTTVRPSVRTTATVQGSSVKRARVHSDAFAVMVSRKSMTNAALNPNARMNVAPTSTTRLVAIAALSCASPATPTVMLVKRAASVISVF